MRIMRTPPILRLTLALLASSFVLCTKTADAQNLVERAEAYVRVGDWDAAHAVLAPEMDKEPYATDARAWFVLGFVQKERSRQVGHRDWKRWIETAQLQPTTCVGHGDFARPRRATARDALDYWGGLFP